MPETLQKLVQVTCEHIGSPGGQSPTSPFTKLKDRWINRASRSIEPPRQDEVQSGSTPVGELSSTSQTDVALARAQRIDMLTKIEASIRSTGLILNNYRLMFPWILQNWEEELVIHILTIRTDLFIHAFCVEYWRAITSGISFNNQRMITCANAIHTDIIDIWNIRDLDEVCTWICFNLGYCTNAIAKFFLGDAFRGQMTNIVDDLSDRDGNVHAG